MARAPRATKSKRTSQARPEQHRICNLTLSRSTDTDWQFAHATASGAVQAPAAAPASVDLRASWWDIGDQEDTGSCVGWASTDGVARYMFVKANRLAQNARLSPRFTWMASKETDSLVTRPETMIEGAGTMLKAAMDILRIYGAAPDTQLPFHIATKMYVGDPNTFFATAAQRKIGAYYNMQRNTAQWRAWLAAHGPILVGLNVDATWDHAASTGGKLDAFQPTTVRGGHAVALVGYRTDGRFIVRNSWGTQWGDKGFAYPTEAYINAAFYSESYGVTL
jgi:C1A family cysteine protease